MSNEEIFKKYGLEVEEISTNMYKVLNPKSNKLNIYDFEYEFNDCYVYAENKLSSDYGFIYIVILGNVDGSKLLSEIRTLAELGVDGALVSGGDKESVRKINIPSLSGITFGESYYE